ncbi:MAG TPA: hypothetical protein VLH85_06385 [Levilinea sp.]|nr:hypothetical protein [Levilinea sp.]
MRIVRIFWFLVAIILGLAGGIYYGWVINPVQYVNTTPDSLRYDYKADYALMVAEIYQVEQNLTLAARRLSLTGSESPARQVQLAIAAGRLIGYSYQDLELLERLSFDLQTWSPDPDETPP